MSLDGWRRALAGDAGGVTLMEAFWSTFHTAALTVALAVPAGWYLAAQVHRAEREGRARLARIIDLLAMVPLVVSGAMVGLGSLLGLLRFAPGMLASPWLLPVAHATLVLPIVVRVLLPAMRQMSPDFEACAPPWASDLGGVLPGAVAHAPTGHGRGRWACARLLAG